MSTSLASSRSSSGGGSSSAGSRKVNETAEERNRRRIEKQQRVGAHRTQILQKLKAKDQEKVAPRRTDFICPIEYDNSLPELPVEAKFIAYPFDEDLMTGYDVLNGVSTELAMPHVLHPEPDLGVRINLMDPRAYIAPPPSDSAAPLDKMDELISSLQFSKPATTRARRDDAAAAKDKVEWMLRPNHMHLDLNDPVYKHANVEATEALANVRVKKESAALLGGPRRKRIDAGFAAVSKQMELVHPTNPRLLPRRVWELLPDPDRTAQRYVHATFDTDPDDGEDRRKRAEQALAPGAKRARLDRALIRTTEERAANSREGTVVAHYLLPSVEDVPRLLVPPSSSSSASSSSSSSSAAAASSGSDAIAEAPLRLTAVRDYHMVVEKRGGAPTPSAAKPSRGSVRVGGEELLALFWDDLNGVVTYAPVGAHASLTAIKAWAAAAEDAASPSSFSASQQPAASTAAMTALVARRPLFPDEEDTLELSRAALDEANPARRIAAVAARKRAVAAQVAAAAAAAAAAATVAPAAAAPAGEGPEVAAPAAGAAAAVATAAEGDVGEEGGGSSSGSGSSSEDDSGSSSGSEGAEEEAE